MYLPEDVKYIIERLMTHGYEAYAVGGCVRDSILGRSPMDWDITTSAMPDQVKAIFDKTFDTGIEHGTITVLLNDIGYEVTTYRIDGDYEDSRHPTQVVFTRNLRDDLLRRDFTINAMAYNDKDGLVDIFQGIEDLDKKKIRCVGDARARLGEDALRILRGIRFSAQLGFEIEKSTKEAIKELAPTLRNISAERIQVEMVKLMTSGHPEYIDIAYKLGVTQVIFPEWDELMKTEQENIHHCYNVGVHTLYALQEIEADKILRLTALLHDIGKPKMKTIDRDGNAHFKGHDIAGEEMASRILRRWKMDNETIRVVCKLIHFHDYRMEATDRNVRHAIYKIGKEDFPRYLEMRKADILAQSNYNRAEKLDNTQELYKLYKEILVRDECTSLKQLAITGNDLLQNGVKQGKGIGETLNLLLEEVIDDPHKNTREYLLKKVRELN